MLYGGNGDDTIMGASKNDYIEGEAAMIISPVETVMTPF